MQNCPYHKMTRRLLNVLYPIRKVLSPHYIKDSLEIADILENISLTFRKMISINVDSLFTNVPRHETVYYLYDFLSNSSFPTPR